MHPIPILLLGMAVVLGAILILRLNAFLALIGAAILVSLLAPGDPAQKITRVATAFGSTAGAIGIVIALAAVIGKAMMDSGAADRIVEMFLKLLGEKRGATAFAASGYLLSIPVFFDTVFYLLVPLARSMYRRTHRDYLKYIMAIAAGAAATHTLVPPTPGPLAIAGSLGIDLGTMILVGALIAVPSTITGLLYAGWIDRRMPIGLREADGVPEVEAAPPPELPGFLLSVAPILLPVLLISANTIVASQLTGPGPHGAFWEDLAPWTSIIGNANLALLIATAIALWVYARVRRPTRARMSAMVEEGLMSGGIIILITSAGGAFGGMLQAAQIGPAIQALFAGAGAASGFVFLFLAFAISALMKTAQGSSTVAMITAAAMMAAMLHGTAALPFHIVYVGTAISGGALVGDWMNDSGFWVIAKMGGFTEIETLKSWTPLAAIVGSTTMVVTLILALVLPLK
jgi:GntP family gluconate:H+ symporter